MKKAIKTDQNSSSVMSSKPDHQVFFPSALLLVFCTEAFRSYISTQQTAAALSKYSPSSSASC